MTVETVHTCAPCLPRAVAPQPSCLPVLIAGHADRAAWNDRQCARHAQASTLGRAPFRPSCLPHRGRPCAPLGTLQRRPCGTDAPGVAATKPSRNTETHSLNGRRLRCETLVRAHCISERATNRIAQFRRGCATDHRTAGDVSPRRAGRAGAGILCAHGISAGFNASRTLPVPPPMPAIRPAAGRDACLGCGGWPA